MAREMNQQLWRHPCNLADEFGRLWLVNLDKTPDGGGSWGITGMPMPVGWTEPLGFPVQYIGQPTGIAGRPDSNRLEVLPGMKKWLNLQKRYEADWKARAFMVAQKLFGTAAHQMIQANDEALMTEVGPRPFPTSAVIQAAINGHKGFLGLAPLTKADRDVLGLSNLEDMGFAAEPAYAESNPQLSPVASAPPNGRLSYPEFVKSMKEGGITDPKTVGAHWTVYKAEVKEAE